MTKQMNREMWAERIRSWKASGKSAAEFAVGENVHAKTLTWWANRLEREGASATRIEMARVQIKRPPGKNTIAVEVGRARVVLENGFDEKLFRAVVAALAPR